MFTVPEPMRVRSIFLLASRWAISASASCARSVPIVGSAAPPESRKCALPVPRYCTDGVMPAVSVASGRSLVMAVVDHAAGVQSASAQTLPGVPARHSHSTRTWPGDTSRSTGRSSDRCRASLPLRPSAVSCPRKLCAAYAPRACRLAASPGAVAVRCTLYALGTPCSVNVAASSVRVL